MATAITKLANFPCCCDQLSLFWYNIMEIHRLTTVVEKVWRQECGQLVIFPSQSGYKEWTAIGGSGGGAEIQVPVFYSSTQCSPGVKHSTTIRRPGVGSHEPMACITHSNHLAKKIKNSVIFNTLF